MATAMVLSGFGDDHTSEAFILLVARGRFDLNMGPRNDERW